MIFLVLLVSPSIALKTTDGTRAASQYVNCGCQCSSLTFQDKWGRTQGNCKTADNTGATWCYVSARSSCVDKQQSVRFSQTGHAWSYEACSTPPTYSSQCSGGFGSSGQQGNVVCKGSRCSPVGGSYPSSGSSSGQYVTGGSISNCRHGQNCNVGSYPGTSSGQFGNGQYGSSSGQYGSSSGQYGSSSGQHGSSSGGSISNCRHGQNCNVGNYPGTSSGQYGGSSSGQFVSGGSIANCRHGQNCNVGSSGQFGSSSGQYGSSGSQYGSSGSQYGSSGSYSGSLSSILQGRKGQKTKDGVNFG